MTVTANAIDLTTLSAVKSWAGVTDTSQDQTIEDAITAFSLYVMHFTGRGPADGSVPAASPFNSVVAYDELYDGNGNDTLPLRNWPIQAVTTVNDSGVLVAASSGLTGAGYVIDQSKKFLVLRGGAAAYRGYRGAQQYGRCGWSLGTQNIEVAYTAGFSAVPFDLEMMAREVVSRNYKSRQAIGQKSQSMAGGAGTLTWDWSLTDRDKTVLEFYKARVA